MAADTGYAVSIVSSQHEYHDFSLHCSIAFDCETRIFLNLVYIPVLRVFISVGSVATELAETGTNLCHDATTSQGNTPKDGFITMTKKKHGHIRAMIIVKNNTIGRKFETTKREAKILNYSYCLQKHHN